MVGIGDARTLDPRAREEHGLDAQAERTGARAALRAHTGVAAAPTVLAAVMLLVASSTNGGFALHQWGPLAVFALVALVVAPMSRTSRPALVMVAALWGYTIWTVVSVAWAQVPGNAVEGGARNLLYAALVTLPILTLPSRRWTVRIGLALTAGLGVVVLLTLVELHRDGASYFLAGRLNDPVGYRNGTAALFALAYWPLVCVAARRSTHALLRALALALAVAAIGLAFLTQSRGVVLGFSGGGVVALALGPDRLRRIWLTILVLAGLAICAHPLLSPYDAFSATNATSAPAVDHAVRVLTWLVVAGFAVAFALALLDGGLRVSPRVSRLVRSVATGALVVLAVAAIGGGLAVIGNPVGFARDKFHEFKQLDAAATGQTRLGSTSGQRYDLWRIAWHEFRSAPVAGVGEGSYEAGYYAERATDRNLSTPHSLPLRVLAENGIVGALLLGAMLIAAALAIARGWRDASPDERRLASGLVAASAVLLVQSSVDWLWAIPGLTGLALVCLAVGVAIVAHPRTEEPARGRAWLPLRAASLVAGLLLIAVVLSDLYVRSARADTAGTPAHRLALARTAGRLDPFSLSPLYLQAGALEDEGRRAAARRRLLDALDDQPRSFVTMALLGDLETRAGHRAAARVWYRRALAANPRDTGLQQLARR